MTVYTIGRGGIIDTPIWGKLPAGGIITGIEMVIDGGITSGVVRRE